KSESLRLRDIRAAFRLIGECRDVGADPDLWHRRMLTGLAALFGVIQAAGGEVLWDRNSRSMQPVATYSVSANQPADNAFRTYSLEMGCCTTPIHQAVNGRTEKLITLTRREVVRDDAWYRSVPFTAYFEPGGLDHQMLSVCQVSDDGTTSVIALNRALGEPDFSARERRLLGFFHAELGRLIGGPLVSAAEPGVAQLSPRLRQTLTCLLEGDSEKQVA